MSQHDQAASSGPRLTVVSRIFLPEPSAASFRLAALVRALAAAGARTDVLTAAPAGQPPGSTPPSAGLPARVRRFGVLRDAAGYVRGYLPYLSFDVPLLWRLLRTRRPDAVLVEPPPTTAAVVRLVCALRRIPYVYYAADIWSDASAATGAPRAVVQVVRMLERFALTGAAGVLSVNDGVTRRAAELGATAISTVGNGVDTSIFNREGESAGGASAEAPGSAAPSAPRPAVDTDGSTDSPVEGHPRSAPPENRYAEVPPGASAEAPGARPAGPGRNPALNASVEAPLESEEGTTAERPFLLYAGTASEWQGAELFARAMPRVLAEVPQARLVYLGQGSSWPTLGQLAEELPPGAVELREPVEAAVSARWQRAARAAVVSLRPGIGYDFAMPTKMFAALACGTPVIFAGTRPAGELIEAEHLGWACEYDVQQVAEAMIAALRTPPTEAERDRLAQWVQQHRSLDAAAERGAEAILKVRQTSPRARVR